MANRPPAERVFAQLELRTLIGNFTGPGEWRVFIASASRAWMVLLDQLRQDFLDALRRYELWRQRRLALAEFEEDPLDEAYYTREARRQGLIADESSDSS